MDPSKQRIGQPISFMPEHFLYSRWQEMAAGQPDILALHDLSGRTWTFGELAAAADHRPPAVGPIAYPAGRSADFLLAVLSAWKYGQVVCPLDGPAPAVLPPEELLESQGISHLKLTSGSTGTPRMVLLTASQLLADCENICATMGLRPDWPNIGLISLAHSYGFSNLVLPLLLRGIPLLLGPDSLPATLTKGLAMGRAFTLPAVPALWRAWRDAAVISPAIRLAISAGAPLTVDLERSIYESTGLKVHNFYGSSECGGIAYDRTATPRSEGQWVGTAMQQVQLSLVDDGRLAVSSQAVATGYWPADSESDAALHAGTFITADLVDLREGEVRLLGRADDSINVAGRKLHPSDVEAVLLSHPSVRCCVVFAVPSADRERCDDIVAAVNLCEESALPEIKRAAAAQLSAWQTPRQWWLCHELEPNLRGKISRAEWRRRYMSRS